jgi:DNA-binding CsgD family transcriptional regulator
MLRLVGEIHDLAQEDFTARKQHLLASLCKLVGAQVGVVSIARNVRDEPEYLADAIPVSWIDHGWAPEEKAVITNYLDGKAYKDSARRDPMDDMLANRRRLVTRQRDQVHADAAWYNKKHVAELRRAARVDDCVYSVLRLPGFAVTTADNWTAGLGVHRSWGDSRRFTRRERQIVHLLHAQLAWLYEAEREAVLNANAETAAADEPQVSAFVGEMTRFNHARLTPRMQQTLQLLLQGLSEKESAAAMGLKRATVHSYVTAIYKEYHVNTRAELLAKCLRPDA